MMILGLNSAILPMYTFEELIEYAAQTGFKCVEVCCWPKGKASRRYAGVTHIDIDKLDEKKIQHIHSVCDKNGIAISALAYYPNALDENTKNRALYITHIKKLILSARKLGVDTITTFIGRISHKTIEENLVVFEKVWTPLVKLAEENKVRIAIENCPMLFTKEEWPGGHNLAYSPAIWRKMFSIIPSKNLGLNYDPSHFIWQQMDYIRPLYEFRDRIFHVHFKDIQIDRNRLNDVGVLATPLEYMTPKLPGLGDVDWSAYVSALCDIRYNGYACIEVEDKAYENSPSDVCVGIEQSYRYLRQFT